jgi:hypothetical protein
VNACGVPRTEVMSRVLYSSLTCQQGLSMIQYSLRRYELNFNRATASVGREYNWYLVIESSRYLKVVPMSECMRRHSDRVLSYSCSNTLHSLSFNIARCGPLVLLRPVFCQARADNAPYP